MTSPTSVEIVGVVLAGGGSRRMGRDKARLRFAGASLVESAVERLRAVTPEVWVADRGRQLVPDCRSIRDGPGGGPAAGILGAAGSLPGRVLLVLACDLPSIPVSLLRRLAGATGGDVLVPRWRRGLEPLCALYRPAALDALAAAVGDGRFALHSLLRAPVPPEGGERVPPEGGERKSLDVRYLEGPELAAFGDPEQVFSNLNTPEDFARLKRRENLRPRSGNR